MCVYKHVQVKVQARKIESVESNTVITFVKSIRSNQGQPCLVGNATNWAIAERSRRTKLGEVRSGEEHGRLGIGLISGPDPHVFHSGSEPIRTNPEQLGLNPLQTKA